MNNKTSSLPNISSVNTKNSFQYATYCRVGKALTVTHGPNNYCCSAASDTPAATYSLWRYNYAVSACRYLRHSLFLRRGRRNCPSYRNSVGFIADFYFRYAGGTLGSCSVTFATLN